MFSDKEKIELVCDVLHLHLVILLKLKVKFLWYLPYTDLQP